MPMDNERYNQTELDRFQSRDFTGDYRLRALFGMIPDNPSWTLFDLGSGNGVIAEMKKDKYAKIVLSDNSKVVVGNLKQKFSKVKNVEILKIDAEDFHIDFKPDIISATDIIEHLADDIKTLKFCYNSLSSGGLVFVSVPAMPFLYGRRDKKYGHYRRYTKKSLEKKLKEAGFNVREIKYWNLTGVLPYFISEKILKKELKGPARSAPSGFGKILNDFLYFLLYLESKILFLPAGLSLVAVASKNEK